LEKETETETMDEVRKVKGLLVDPYQRRVHEVVVDCDIHAWHTLLDCDCLDVAHVGDHDGLSVDVWVDDEGLLQQPMPPCFRWGDYPNPLAGYGLVLSSDSMGESHSTNLTAKAVSLMVSFETKWELRIDPESVFDQLSRIYPDQWGNFGMGSKSL
jgi:hypothetical protein